MFKSMYFNSNKNFEQINLGYFKTGHSVGNLIKGNLLELL